MEFEKQIATRVEAGWAQGVVLHPTGIAVDGGGDGDGVAFLRPNYPNPFTPRTTISFSLPEAADVRVAIYDAAGSQVAWLLALYWML